MAVAKGRMKAPSAPESLAIYAMPGHLIRRMHQVSTALFEAEVAAIGFDVTPVQYAALCAAEASPGVDQVTLASAIAYDSVTIGGVLQRLEAKGYIRRELTAADRRARCVFLTDEGAGALAALAPAVARAQERMFAGLSAAEGERLKTLLSKALVAVSDQGRAPFRPFN